MDDATNAGPGRWIDRPTHRAWLLRQAEGLFAFFERASRNPLGGFFDLDDDGRPLRAGPAAGTRQIHATARMVHGYSMARLLGRPGADAVIDHGMAALWTVHRDAEHGGYLTAVAADGSSDGTKGAYGHAFVLLAAASAKAAGHPDADRLLADVSAVVFERFWETPRGAVIDAWARDWSAARPYRGQNGNMHLCEALMGAFEATGERGYLARAEGIADLIVHRHAAARDWRLPEHFTSDWRVDEAYAGDAMFRPYGTTPGHWLEWSRLLLQLWELGGRRPAWAPDAARALFARAVEEGWDVEKGGFYYTLDHGGRPHVAERYWWPCCEGIGAAAFLGAIDGNATYEAWYRRVWDFTARHFIDGARGGWYPQIDAEGRPASDPFYGKPDIYHAVQACLIPLLPTTNSVVGGLATVGIEG